MVVLLVIRVIIAEMVRGQGGGSSGVGAMLGSLNEILVFGNDRFAQQYHNERIRPQPVNSGAPANQTGPRMIRDRYGNPSHFVYPDDR